MLVHQQKDIPTLIKDTGLVETRRRQIVQAAVDLFIQKGFHKTTTREIASRANFSIGTLYEYIQSKEDILYLVCEFIHSEMEKQVKEAIKPADTGRDTLKNAIDRYLRVCDRMQDHILLIYRETASLPGDSISYVLKNEARITGMFEDILTRGKDDGTLKLRHHRGITLIAHNIAVLGHMWTFRRWFLKKAFTLDEYIELQTSLILNELSSHNGAGPP
ncbi:MAG: TetR/AcrR family transcriptional regulator [Deltaproteobacteria bacterium]|nr:TetR/AcrR family transcriptional regulator [Deltaproteobacteria bacterium]